ncbi:MAG: PAS domain-containing protein, partial [SAR324 cluster bacterium]|nr:PAS domain-containing protein [SAR324 cluster bacterium]
MEALSGFAYEWDALKDEILFSEDVQNLNLPKKLISSKTSKEVLELMHPDDIDEYLLNIKKHFKNEIQGFVTEYRIPSDNGEWRWFQQRSKGIRDHSGKVIKMYGLIQDIHQEKIESDKLKLADSRLDELMQNSTNGIFIWSAERKLVKINKAGKDRFREGFGIEAEIGFKHKDAYINGVKKRIFELPPGEDLDEWAGRQFDERLKNAGIPFEIKWKDGIWLRHLNTKMKDGGFITITTDITEIKQHEKELEEQKELYSFLIDSINGVVFDWDLETQKVDYSINPNHESIASQFLNFSNEQEVFEILDPQDHQ